MPLSRALCRHLPLFASAFLVVAGGGACSSSDGGAPGGDSGPAPDAAATLDGSTGTPPPDGAATDSAPADATPTDGGPTDGGATVSTDGGLPFRCTTPPAPGPCPAPSGADGEASFCYRPLYAGVTAVEVYVGTGSADQWTTPFATLTADASGRYTSPPAPIANGTYPYVFHVVGVADGLFVATKGAYLRDPENPNFQPYPAGAPQPARSYSTLTVPQPTYATYKITGTLTYGGAAQPCYGVELDVGELDKPDSDLVLSEHGPGNYTETLADGTFTLTSSHGPVGVIIRYPFGLSSSYPDLASTPSLGIVRTTTAVPDADVPLPSVDIAFPLSDYAQMSPAPGATLSLPITFDYPVLSGYALAHASVTSTDVAGDDPAYANAFGTATSVTWDGQFGSGDAATEAKPNTTYYWGAWEETTDQGGWVGESLLFPITVQ